MALQSARVPAKPSNDTDRIGEFLKGHPDLSDEDRSLVRRVLQKASYIDLAGLIAFKAPDRSRRRETAFSDLESRGDPVLVGFAILAGIALAAVGLVIVQW